jgi:hypothetical protein
LRRLPLAAGGVLIAVSCFLPWQIASVDVLGRHAVARFDGVDLAPGQLTLGLAVASVALALLKRRRWSLAAALLAGAIVVQISWLSAESWNLHYWRLGRARPGAGLWVALGGAAITIAGFFVAREHHGSET